MSDQTKTCDDWEDMQHLVRLTPHCSRREMAYALADYWVTKRGLDQATANNMYQVAELALYLVKG